MFLPPSLFFPPIIPERGKEENGDRSHQSWKRKKGEEEKIRLVPLPKNKTGHLACKLGDKEFSACAALLFLVGGRRKVQLLSMLWKRGRTERNHPTVERTKMHGWQWHWQHGWRSKGTTATGKKKKKRSPYPPPPSPPPSCPALDPPLARAELTTRAKLSPPPPTSIPLDSISPFRPCCTLLLPTLAANILRKDSSELKAALSTVRQC